MSGYDGMRSTLSFTPCITTAMVPFFEMGRRAVHIIDKKQDCPEKVGDVFFDAVLQPRESCGCMASEGQEVMQIRQRMYEMDNISQNREMQFHFMSIHMSECHTLEEVGREFQVTRERIRQIEAKALRKLRHPTRSRKLRDFLEE